MDQKAALKELLAKLRLLAMYYQTAHWQVKSSTYYADHVLFERLYNETNEQIDGIAERAVGLTDMEAVSLADSLSMMSQFKLPTECKDNSEYAKAGLALEKSVMGTIDRALEGASAGTRNLLEGLADVSEKHVYLLKQRLSQ